MSRKLKIALCTIALAGAAAELAKAIVAPVRTEPKRDPLEGLFSPIRPCRFPGRVMSADEAMADENVPDELKAMLSALTGGKATSKKAERDVDLTSFFNKSLEAQHDRVKRLEAGFKELDRDLRDLDVRLGKAGAFDVTGVVRQVVNGG